jgi:hypothetical protein
VAPTAADLDDPLGYVDRFMSRGTKDEMDTALDALLSQGGGVNEPDPGGESGSGREGGPGGEGGPGRP